MKNLKKFVGEYAYNIIKNMAVDNEAIRKALVTPQNARAVFSELTEYEIKELCSEISSNGTIGKVRKTTQKEIVDAFNSVGYDKVIFDDEEAILECKKYYQQGEMICTYNNLEGRMSDYHMLVAIKSDIDNIKRSKTPKREDEYGTSILNIQIARSGSHMSIKNRYNHTVSEPDSTLNNNLNILYNGLQEMVLGYYGFASLNSKKSNYKKIVNIDGIYLKYHTEKDNVYFGAFVLDGVNGVRFADTSQYYVTKGEKCINRYYYEPLVLDFKNKKAIDILQKKTKVNGKVPLLSRAIDEGILTSANKNEADTLTAVFHNVKKELLKSNKNSLKYIHEVYGYDFTKPYKVTGILGKFTAKSIEKLTGSDTGILLMYTNGELEVCELNSGKFNAKDLQSNWGYNISSFFTQGDFEQKRKSGNLATYVIQQEVQYVGKPKFQKRNSYCYYDRKSNQKFDKSGNNITLAREELHRRLKQYKSKKQALEAANIDYTQDIEEITKSFNNLKIKMITHLTKAETPEDYNVISDVINYNLIWLVSDIKSVKNKVIEKSFQSVDNAYKSINNIKDKIAKLELKLK